MSKTKTREITIRESKGSFSILKSSSKGEYNFSGLTALRQLLNNEKAKIIYTIKTKKPNSIYDLAKKLNRTFKGVNDDLKVLEKFGFIEFIEEKTKKRVRHKPVLIVDTMTIHVKI